MTSFTLRLKEINREYKLRMQVVLQEATQELVRQVQVTTGEGGRMRVVTGFLRGSIRGAINQVPMGDSDNPTGRIVNSDASTESISVALLKWDPNKGDDFYVGWTANYARFREYHDRFLGLAVQNWDMIVDDTVKSVRGRRG